MWVEMVIWCGFMMLGLKECEFCEYYGCMMVFVVEVQSVSECEVGILSVCINFWVKNFWMFECSMV